MKVVEDSNGVNTYLVFKSTRPNTSANFRREGDGFIVHADTVQIAGALAQEAFGVKAIELATNLTRFDVTQLTNAASFPG